MAKPSRNPEAGSEQQRAGKSLQFLWLHSEFQGRHVLLFCCRWKVPKVRLAGSSHPAISLESGHMTEPSWCLQSRACLSPS